MGGYFASWNYEESTRRCMFSFKDDLSGESFTSVSSPTLSQTPHRRPWNSLTSEGALFQNQHRAFPNIIL